MDMMVSTTYGKHGQGHQVSIILLTAHGSRCPGDILRQLLHLSRSLFHRITVIDYRQLQQGYSNMKLCLVALIAFIITPGTTAPNPSYWGGPAPKYRYPPPSVRGRPPHGYKRINFQRWPGPPGDWLEGTWYLVNSSHIGWAENFEDLMVEHSSSENSYKSEDLIFSWSSCTTTAQDASQCTIEEHNKTIVGGHNDPIWARGPTEHTPRAAWNFTADTEEDSTVPGFLSSLMAWGTDTDDSDYYVLYHTDSNEAYGQGRGSISLASRNVHLSPDTLDEVMGGLEGLAKKLEDVDLATIVGQIKPISHTDEEPISQEEDKEHVSQADEESVAQGYEDSVSSEDEGLTPQSGEDA